MLPCRAAPPAILRVGAVCTDCRFGRPHLDKSLVPMLNSNRDARLRLAWFIMASLLAVFVYFYGLGSQHIPKNSDEYLYVHVARMTAESGHWLPLQSELDYGRNFKPPMMFWHAIVATDWGQQWDLWHLRYPSVIYTLLTSLLVFLLAKRLTGKTVFTFPALPEELATELEELVARAYDAYMGGDARA